ncbi:Uncharacterized protein FWK35_00032489 [Aphis craccivora]|uniref:DUF4806 domain-containing protein n=1 Tax=Aphis craccivora TaxID=307492 RepID=A0A6G0W454_APHCR|nr:Uncharacterized protein FWK35_00032489 [Aphis craccivora]
MTSERTKRRKIREELDSFKDNNFNTDSSIPDKDYLNYLPLNVNSSSQKCLNDNLVPLKHVDLCSEVKSKLAEWAVSFNVPHNTLNGLQSILKDIPGLTQMLIDARTILKSNIPSNMENKSVQVIAVNPGYYYHFGLGLAIKNHFCLNPIINIDIIQIVIGIDGLPLSKSSSSQFWSILGYIRPFKDSVFLIALYWGHEKPKDSNEFLNEFVVKTKNLLLNGINIDGTIKQIQIDGFCLDTPAKSFILKIKGHARFDFCTRCLEEGDYLKNRICFPYSSNSAKRTHNDYLVKKYEELHVGHTISILSDLPINIINSFYLDYYMHLTCLGLMQKLLHLWINNGPLNVRLHSSVSKQLSSSLLN